MEALIKHFNMQVRLRGVHDLSQFSMYIEGAHSSKTHNSWRVVVIVIVVVAMLCSKKYSMTITNEIAVLRVVLYLKFGFLQGVGGDRD